MIDERAVASKFIMTSATDCSIDLSSQPSCKWCAGCLEITERKKALLHAHTHANAHINDVQEKKEAFAIQ